MKRVPQPKVKSARKVAKDDLKDGNDYYGNSVQAKMLRGGALVRSAEMITVTQWTGNNVVGGRH